MRLAEVIPDIWSKLFGQFVHNLILLFKTEFGTEVLRFVETDGD